MTKTRYFFFALIALVVRVSLAQESSSHHVSITQRLQVNRSAYADELREIVSKLDPARLRPAVAGSWEDQVLTAGEKSAQLLFHLKVAERGRAGLFTLPTDKGDVLVARWIEADARQPERGVWLWDTPFYTTFVIEIDQTVFQTDQLARYCEGLFAWGRGALIKSLRLATPNSEDGRKWVLGLPEVTETEQGSFQAWFMAMADKTNAYVAVGVFKPMVATEYPPEAFQVPERFPPLRARLANLPSHALLDELGRGYDGSTRYPTSRDAIVMAELLARGPISDVEVRQIIVGNFDDGSYQNALVINSRAATFLRALEARQDLAAYQPALERVFVGTKINHALEDAVIGHVFGAMERQHLDFSPAALRFLEADRFTRQSLFYLNMNAQDEETLQKLSGIAVKTDLQQEKRVAVENIKRRVASR